MNKSTAGKAVAVLSVITVSLITSISSIIIAL